MAAILIFSAIFDPVYGFIILCRCFNIICVKLQCFTYEKEYFFFGFEKEFTVLNKGGGAINYDIILYS